ncbi:plasmid maintenance protein (plasmid) [Borreliella valaisiana]|uniref:plasmid maintenance protein n=1 Tax=Borreliella valaisiana TaxID=62088 RepID=UPI002738100E|nr:plasmid maintenance protein [Borreliella valaisiana]WLN25730.1 plasmid maintenance protein [Borreliella valaisiana]
MKSVISNKRHQTYKNKPLSKICRLKKIISVIIYLNKEFEKKCSTSINKERFTLEKVKELRVHFQGDILRVLNSNIHKENKKETTINTLRPDLRFLVGLKALERRILTFSNNFGGFKGKLCIYKVSPIAHKLIDAYFNSTKANLIRKVKEEKDALKEEKYALKEEKYALKEEKYALKEEKYALKEEKYALKEEKYALKEEKYALKEEKDALKEKKDALKEEKYALKEEKYALKEEKYALKEEKYALKEEKDALKEKKDALKEKKGYFKPQNTTENITVYNKQYINIYNKNSIENSFKEKIKSIIYNTKEPIKTLKNTILNYKDFKNYLKYDYEVKDIKEFFLSKLKFYKHKIHFMRKNAPYKTDFYTLAGEFKDIYTTKWKANKINSFSGHAGIIANNILANILTKGLKFE